MFWGNSGYLRFSVTCPFGCSAGRFLAPMAQNGPFWAKKAMQWPSWRPNCNRIKLPFWCLVVMVTKNLMPFEKVWILAPKNAFLTRKSVFFLRYSQITPLFHLRWTLLNGIITSTCPEVTLDAFGFPLGAHSTARRAIFWHRLPKMALFWANNALFWSEMYHMLSYSIVGYWTAFYCIKWYILFPYGIAWCCIVLHCIALYCIVSYGILCYLMVSNSIARFCVAGFGERAVSRKTPICFIVFLAIFLQIIALQIICKLSFCCSRFTTLGHIFWLFISEVCPRRGAGGVKTTKEHICQRRI